MCPLGVKQNARNCDYFSLNFVFRYDGVLSLLWHGSFRQVSFSFVLPSKWISNDTADHDLATTSLPWKKTRLGIPQKDLLPWSSSKSVFLFFFCTPYGRKGHRLAGICDPVTQIKGKPRFLCYIQVWWQTEACSSSTTFTRSLMMELLGGTKPYVLTESEIRKGILKRANFKDRKKRGTPADDVYLWLLCITWGARLTDTSQARTLNSRLSPVPLGVSFFVSFLPLLSLFFLFLFCSLSLWASASGAVSAPHCGWVGWVLLLCWCTSVCGLVLWSCPPNGRTSGYKLAARSTCSMLLVGTVQWGRKQNKPQIYGSFLSLVFFLP